MSLRIELTDRAEAHIRSIDVWWQEHRPSARYLFRDELAAALDTIRLMPLSGSTYPLRRAQNARRFLLRASRYHVYYRVGREAIRVIAVWSSVRGRGPDIAPLR